MSSEPARTRERRTVKAVAGLTVVVLGVIGFASYELVARTGQSARPAAAAGGPGQSSAVAGGQGQSSAVAGGPGQSGAAHRTPAVASTSPEPSPSPSVSASSASPTPLAVRMLKPVSAEAFGPKGTADGDGPEQTGYAIDDSMTTNWRTDWYATPRFAGLQAGTGLLVDMGRTETITGVQVTLDPAPGADVELRAGRTPTMADLATVASSAGAGGTIQLKPASPVQARYLLIWFTVLPPDGIGTYQGRIYNVTVAGAP
ncbi:MAG TPA: hypothetical protein VF070_17220 [Streptosporangiaceae bacterium]